MQSLTLATLVLWCAATFPAPAAATPSVSLHWNSCTGPIDLAPGAGTVQKLVVSETGLSGPVYGFQVQLHFRSLGGGLGDAWRFDANGCEANRWSAVITSAPACPALVLPGLQTLSAFRYTASALPPPGGVSGMGTLQFAEASLTPASADGGTAQFVEFDFDQGNAKPGPGSTAAACGCLDRPMCVEIASASFLDTPSDEVTLPLAQGFVRWNDPSGTATYCGTGVDCWPSGYCQFDSTCVAPVAAHGTSWGRLKGMYRAPAR